MWKTAHLSSTSRPGSRPRPAPDAEPGLTYPPRPAAPTCNSGLPQGNRLPDPVLARTLRPHRDHRRRTRRSATVHADTLSAGPLPHCPSRQRPCASAAAAASRRRRAVRHHIASTVRLSAATTDEGRSGGQAYHRRPLCDVARCPDDRGTTTLPGREAAQTANLRPPSARGEHMKRTALVLTAAVLLTGCGGQDSDTAAANTTSAPASSGTQSEVEANASADAEIAAQ